ncbi:ThuA domain-containing protein [Pseudorhodoferax sp. LjRoot39]|uniref:ThuA domain-containing protein n=1 Tax=Pseudorhodoferax sp. LjRoot39 TaxID=3342328 RepID=UPI003ECDDAD6
MHRRIDGQGGRRMLACAMALAGAGLAPAAFAQQGAPAPGSLDTQYNACRGTNPNCYNDWGAFANTPNKVLIYSRTAGPRHANLGPALAPGLNPPLAAANAVQNGLIRLLAAEGIQADWTEDVARMTSLNGYKAIIFASPTRDALWDHAKSAAGGTQLDAARHALRQYMRRGGGFVGIHNAFGTEYNWPYYEGLLGNANFYDHGANQNGTVRVVNKNDSSTSMLPASWAFKDEWYTLMPYPTNVKFLMVVDTNSLATKRSTHPGHGKMHPVSWCQYYDGGRSWVTTLGHDAGAFAQDTSTFPGAAEFQKHVVAGIKSAMGLVPFCK